MISEWSRLWECPSEYVLVRVGDEEFAIVELESKSAIIIEDDTSYKEVVRRMKEAGVCVTDRLPF